MIDSRKTNREREHNIVKQGGAYARKNIPIDKPTTNLAYLSYRYSNGEAPTWGVRETIRRPSHLPSPPNRYRYMIMVITFFYFLLQID